MILKRLYWNRRVFYAGLTLMGGMMLIDAVPQYTLLHGKLKQAIDPALDVTGLWQGSWALFAPMPDHVNVRVTAELNWGDGSQTVWQQPNWQSMSPWAKMRYFRQMSYYDGLWRSSNAAAWEPFCEKLAEQESRAKTGALKSIVLFQQRDVIPHPARQWRTAYGSPRYSERSQLYTWVVDE